MDWQNHNSHLSAGEYSNKKQQWGKMMKQWGIDRFILEILGGQKEYYRDITSF